MERPGRLSQWVFMESVGGAVFADQQVTVAEVLSLFLAFAWLSAQSGEYASSRGEEQKT